MKSFKEFTSEGIVDKVKQLNHTRLAAKHDKLSSQAFDKGDEEAFAKHQDISMYHQLKAGKKIRQVPNPEKFMDIVKKKHNLGEEQFDENGGAMAAMIAAIAARKKAAKTNEPSKPVKKPKDRWDTENEKAIRDTASRAKKADALSKDIDKWRW